MFTKKTIYLIRHGQTDFNKRGIIQGSGVDSELNEEGHRQAERFFKAYHHIPFDRIYSSQLKRATQSVQPFVDLGTPFNALSYFNEISWGDLEGVPSTPQSHRLFVNTLEDWKAGLLDRAVEGGESPKELVSRQRKGLEHLHAQTNEQTILLCMHGRCMRTFLCLLTGTPLETMDQFNHSNLALYILEWNGTNYEIVEANSTDHLWI